MASRIEDYALIGDLHTAALVGRDGSLDWLCVPRFDSPACFAALLGTPENGFWKIAPGSGVRRTSRRYRGPTLVLETEVETEQGTFVLIDFMPERSEFAEVVRIVEGRSGTVPIHVDLAIRFDYGSIVPWVRQTRTGIRATAGPDTLFMRCDVPLRGEDLHTVGNFTVQEGERVRFSLVWSPTHASEPPVRDPDDLLTATEEWWRSWAERCTYDGPWREPVLRSLITLKALTYQPTGGIVAAATTSLPEKIGGTRNWDYRYCWLRDATFTLYALLTAGYVDEARDWRDWLVDAVAGTPSELQIMYGLAGERRLTELELPWLAGYENSRPVRIGNAAATQFQLDVYGEIMDALHVARRAGLHDSQYAWCIQRALLGFVDRAWQQPDEGIWEVRGPRRHFVHSKVMAWVAMDRGVKAVERFGESGDVELWRRTRDAIHRQVLCEGFNSRLNSFVQSFGSEVVDASLLMLPLVGFIPADEPRMVGTVQAIERHLLRDGFVQRYSTTPEIDGLPPGEGAFFLCTFWLADNLELQERHDEAHEVFERLLSLRNDVGLLAEQYDPRAKRMIGNFPQAFSHQALINTARNLSRTGGSAVQRPATGAIASAW
jgi:GH15 family glucan-1,4-alpha-glucosidase